MPVYTSTNNMLTKYSSLVEYPIQQNDWFSKKNVFLGFNDLHIWAIEKTYSLHQVTMANTCE